MEGRKRSRRLEYVFGMERFGVGALWVEVSDWVGWLEGNKYHQDIEGRLNVCGCRATSFGSHSGFRLRGLGMAFRSNEQLNHHGGTDWQCALMIRCGSSATALTRP